MHLSDKFYSLICWDAKVFFVSVAAYRVLRTATCRFEENIERPAIFDNVYMFVGLCGCGVVAKEKGDTSLIEKRCPNRYTNLLKSILKQSKL